MKNITYIFSQNRKKIIITKKVMQKIFIMDYIILTINLTTLKSLNLVKVNH